MKKALLFFIFIITAVPFTVFAGSNDPALKTKVTQWMRNTGGIRFLENKGQMMDMQRKAVNNVLFKAGAGGVDVYVTTAGLSYVFVDLKRYKKQNGLAFHLKKDNDSITETWCRADMQLVGADIRKENIVKEDESGDRTDYYYGDVCPNGALNVHTYGKVTIKNIYPGIDWVLHSGKNGLKYDFVVHPGANPALIKLKYKWTDKPQLQDDGSLKITTPMGTVMEGTPVSYTDDKSKVQTAYSIENNEIHFNTGTYNSTETLTIDPPLVWATYYGGGGTPLLIEEVYDMQDDGTSVWITGFVNTSTFPTLNPGGGSYFQGVLTGNQNMYILQFSNAGVLEWATFYGGSSNDYGSSIYSNGKNVWVAGGSESPNFPTLNPGGGAYFQGSNAAPKYGNAVILEFSVTGVRKWATYYGGTFYDDAMFVHSSGASIWVTGIAGSTNFPTFNPGGGAYFQNTLKGINNLFILQFDTARVRKWATYYGGSSQSLGDEGLSINSTPTNVWVTGFTSSIDFPTFNPGGGAYFQGSIDSVISSTAYILQFSNTGVRKWATYLGGNDTTFVSEVGNSIYADSNSVWVTGQTGSSNFPTLNPGGGAYFQSTFTAVRGNAFISQFSHSGVMKWSTYYGGSQDDGGYSIQSDGSNIWLSGYTSSPDFPLYKSSCGYYDSALGNNHNPNNQDVFILQFTTGGVRQWATYYGFDRENDDSYAWSDGSNLLVAGDASINGYPTKNPGGGAYFLDTTLSTTENIFVGKFRITGAGASANVSICQGSSTTLSASGGISYSWSPSTGLSATNIPNPVANPTVTTTYTVTIVDTGVCGGTFKDSVKVTVDTLNFKNIRISRDTTLCAGNPVTLKASGGPTYNWSTGATTSAITIANDTATNTYTVAVSNGACIKDTSVTVTVTPKLSGAITGNLSICNGHSTTLTATNGTSYQWNNGATTNSITVSPSSNTTYSVLILQGGCTASVSASVTVNAAPSISACCDSSIKPGQNVLLSVSGTGNNYSYLWIPNYDINCTNCPDPTVTPQQTTTYTVAATNDSNGCVSLGYVTIDVSCGDVFVPDAFTPNAGYNKILFVRGNCIASILFEIFDRWGNRVFRSDNMDIGWDGNHNGKPMNMDTYIWFLHVTSKFGDTIDKKGNVTLVR